MRGRLQGSSQRRISSLRIEEDCCVASSRQERQQQCVPPQHTTTDWPTHRADELSSDDNKTSPSRIASSPGARGRLGDGLFIVSRFPPTRDAGASHLISKNPFVRHLLYFHAAIFFRLHSFRHPHHHQNHHHHHDHQHFKNHSINHHHHHSVIIWVELVVFSSFLLMIE